VAGTVPRTRLLAALASTSDARLRLVCGPAGAGKSVLLRQLAARTDGHVSFVRTPGDLPGVLAADGPRTVFVDDADALSGMAGPALATLVADAPPPVRFVVATRDDRLLEVTDVPGPVHRVGHADLRFDQDDVARLFADVYGTPLRDEDAAALCDRVEGLAVALRMVHLDTLLLAPADREAALTDPLACSERLRAFLGRDVLGVLPEPMRDFMVAVSPFGVLDPALCDAHLGRTDSAAVLAELAARQALTFRVRSDGPAYRFHALLQRLLEETHLEHRGAHLTRKTYHSSARRLAAAGYWAEAYRGYARAGDWVSAARVLHRFGAGDGGTRASAVVPRAVLDEDPWVVLAEARMLRADGRFAEAYDRYLAAEHRLADRRDRWQCALERSRLAHWVTGDRPGSPLVDDVSAHLAAAVRGHPARLVAMAVPADSPEWVLGRSLAALLHGRSALALELAVPLTGRAGPFVSLAARLLAAVVRARVHGEGSVAVFAFLAGEAEDAGWLWLARIARAAGAILDEEACADAAAIVADCDERGDDWGALLAAYLLTAGVTRAGRVDAAVVRADAVARAQRLGAHFPDDWLGAAPVRRDPPVAPCVRSRPRLVVAPPPPAEVHCLGAFRLVVAGEPVDLTELRAQARRVLRVLSMQYGQPMHEERLVVALWPDAPLKRAKHRLQVAISSLRALLRTHLGEDGGVVRQGSAYLLRLPEGSVVDVVAFDNALRRWRAARQARDTDQVREAGREVLDRYRGELLVEEGAAEWVLTRREALRGEAVAVAAELARFELDHGNAALAAEVCERGLTVDELDHRLWTLLADARQREGNPGAARRARQVYRALITEA
jgi:DNA-binding SARP family transcriptional activator